MSDISKFLDSITNDPNFKNPDGDEALNLSEMEPSALIFTRDTKNQPNIKNYLDELTDDSNMDPDTGEILTKKEIEKIKIDVIDEIADAQEEEKLPFLPDEDNE